jgi:hypothetical protein
MSDYPLGPASFLMGLIFKGHGRREVFFNDSVDTSSDLTGFLPLEDCHVDHPILVILLGEIEADIPPGFPCAKERWSSSRRR